MKPEEVALPAFKASRRHCVNLKQYRCDIFKPRDGKQRTSRGSSRNNLNSSFVVTYGYWSLQGQNSLLEMLIL